MVIRGARVVTLDGVRDGDVVVDEGRIQAIEPGLNGAAEGEIVDAAGLYLLPGFIETHTHGAELFEFTGGYFQTATGEFEDSKESWQRGLPAFASFLARTGVTNACLATWAAPVEQLARAFGFLRTYMDSGRNGEDGARLLGGNLEGTFINPNMAGAQNPARILEPKRDTFDAINRAGAIRLANICPELDGALDLIEHVREQGVIPGFGHTNATGDQVARAVQHGLRYCVHFLNGPTGSSHKRFNDGGAVEAVLRTKEIYAEVIVDTYHVHPAYVRGIIHRKGAGRVMAVTDQMFATGATGISSFEIGGIPGELSGDRRYVRVANKPDTLFSSVLEMQDGFGNLLNMLTREMEGMWTPKHDALPFDEAVVAVSRLCSTSAAEMMGIDGETGSIAPGKRADLVLARIEGEPGDYGVIVEQTYVAGKRVV